MPPKRKSVLSSWLNPACAEKALNLTRSDATEDKNGSSSKKAAKTGNSGQSADKVIAPCMLVHSGTDAERTAGNRLDST